MAPASLAHIPPKASLGDFSLGGKNPYHPTCDIQWPPGSSGLKVKSCKLNQASLGLELGVGPAIFQASLVETLTPCRLKAGRFCLHTPLTDKEAEPGDLVQEHVLIP